MYEINRVRLIGIGPRGARYTDVMLDLAGLGEPVQTRNLYDADQRRPSPYTLLMLENGGGKSVLLKLLFSVVLPGRRKTVGGAALDKFVLDGDTGHVALEWMNVATGDRLVTAKVYQRRTRTASNTNPLAEAWYSFRPSETLSLDLLPAIADRRRRRIEGYREAVEEADHAAPATALAWLGDDQGRWMEHLRDHGIEPDLFDIQRHMNADEGEAAKAFKFTSSRDFVNWLLTIVTDPKDAASVAQTFGEWATTLASREQMLLERDFLEGAIAGLDPLAEAHLAQIASQGRASAALTDASQLAAALGARFELERQKVITFEGQLSSARSAAGSLEAERDQARQVLNEVKLQTLRLHLDEVEAQQLRVAEQSTAAELELAGWETLSVVAERDQAIAASEQLGEQLAAADEHAAPALARRDEAAARLLAKYDAEAAVGDAQAQEHDRLAEAADQQAVEADAERDSAVGDAAAAAERHSAAQQVIAKAVERLARATADGLVPGGTVLRQVPGMAEEGRVELQRLRTNLKDRDRAVSTATDAIRAAEREQSAAADELAKRAKQADHAKSNLDAVVSEADRLVGLEVIARAAGPGDAVDQDTLGGLVGQSRLTADDLDDAADRLLGLLTGDVRANAEREEDLRIAQREDARVIAALGDGGLLPARPEVERALSILEAAKIPAHAGWAYLAATVPADERPELIAAHPALADGLVLIDAEQLDDAHTALADAHLLPAAAVAVGPGAALLAIEPPQASDAAPSQGFVIEPTPALYDEAAAAARRGEIHEQMTARGEEIQALETQLTELRDARGELRRWRHDNPPGRLARLRADLAAAKKREQSAADRLAACDDLVQERSSDLGIAERALKHAGDEERSAERNAAALDSLAELVADAIDAQVQLDTLATTITDQQSRAQHAARRSSDARKEATRQVQLAAQIRAQVDRHRAACAEVPSTSGKRAAYVPTESLAQLKAEAVAAQETYLAVATDADLRHQAEAAATRVNDLRAELAIRDPRHVAEAERLRSTPAAADRAGWAVGAAQARNALTALRKQSTELTKRAGQLDEAVKVASPTVHGRRTWTTLEESWRPTSVEHGELLQVEAREALGRVQATFEEKARGVAELDEKHRRAELTASGVRTTLVPLETMLPDLPAGVSAEPYDGDLEAMRAASGAAVTDLRETRDEVERCRQVREEAGRQLVGFANQTRYDALTANIRRTIVETHPDALAARAAEWSTSLQARLLTLTGDLDNANRYRQAIVERLAALVDHALRTLRQANRLSRLPDDLAEWSGRPFLKIAFSQPDDAAVAVRVAEVVDRLAADYAGRGDTRSGSGRRDGMSLLLESVHAAVPKGFAVDVLKPDSVLRDERVSIEEMNDIFSGGQELTAAIVLYCTLAALRANERGQVRSRHSGVLFLDNPIGRANASYLLDVQQAVARALGVQLIYTTGISDDRVLAEFPLWIRLRNDADLRAGMKHIQVAELVRRHLPPPYDEDESVADERSTPGTVTATRVYRRPKRPSEISAQPR